MPLSAQDLNDWAADMELCDLGLALTTGALRRQYAAKRAQLMAALKADNEALGLAEMTTDEILAELES